MPRPDDMAAVSLYDSLTGDCAHGGGFLANDNSRALQFWQVGSGDLQILYQQHRR